MIIDYDELVIHPIADKVRSGLRPRTSVVLIPVDEPGIMLAAGVVFARAEITPAILVEAVDVARPNVAIGLVDVCCPAPFPRRDGCPCFSKAVGGLWPK